MNARTRFLDLDNDLGALNQRQRDEHAALKRTVAAELCAIHNESTNPRAFRTDHEHRRHSQRARIAYAYLRRHFLEGYDWHEGESGRVYPGRWPSESGVIYGR